ncbi:hypothetical protein COCON_G00188680 [Conger conger]|uniref:Beta-defensin n=1 Tax=Conger conger TaxID=82655 RepID=A0A9Q1D2P2_CONCO|nr:hypothetical protein COCON_G00188680 [Conger conger]
MERLSFVVFVLLLLSAGQAAPAADDAEVQSWMCGYKGHCRRFCNIQEYVVGYDGCPRRYRCCVLRA